MPDRSLNLGTIFTANIDDFIAKVRTLRSTLGSLNEAYSRAGSSSEKAFKQTAAGVDKVGTSVKRSSGNILEYSKQIGKVEGAWKRVLAAMKVTASYGLAASAIFSLVQAFKAGAKEIVDYDQALKNLQAITRSTNAEVTGMGETIKSVASETKFSTGEVAEGMVLLGQAGFSATESMQSMQSVADLATGTLTDLGTASDLVTTTIRAFGLSTIESSRVADVMANAVNRSKLTIDKLRTAFNYVGAAASQTGLSLEETAASMMVLANNGLRASTIGTGLRQVLARLLAPNRNLREEFEAQGIALETVNPKLVGYQTAMKNMTSVIWDNARGVVDMTKAYRLFGLRGAQAAAVLARAFAGTGPGSFDDMLNKTYEIGSAADMAGTQMEGLGVKIKNLADRAKLIAVAFGEGGAISALKVFIDALRGLAKVMADFLSTDLGRIITSFGVWSVTIGLTTRAIVALIPVMKSLAAVISLTRIATFAVELIKVSQAVGLVRAAMWALQGAMVGALGPIALVAVTLGGIITAIRWYMGSTQRAIDSTVKLTQASATAADTLKVYEASLRDIASKKEQGIDVTREHAAQIRRLVVAYGPLKGKVDESTESLEKNIEAVRKAYGEEVQKRLEQNTRLVELYAQRLKEVELRYGILKVSQDILGTSVDWLIDKYIRLLNLLARVVTFFPRLILSILSYVPVVGTAIGKLSEEIDELLSNWGDKVRVIGKDTKEFKGVMEEQTNAFVEMAKILKSEKGESIEGITKRLQAMGATTDQIDAVTSALTAQGVAAEEARIKMESEVANLPNMFKDYYDKLDARQKAAFADTLSNIDKEIAAFKKKAAEIKGMGVSEWASIETIRAEHLAKFIDDQNKEKMEFEELAKLKIDIISGQKDKIEEEYNEITRVRMNQYLRETGLAQENKDQLLKLEQKFNADLETERTAASLRMQGVEVAIARQTELLKMELAKKTAEEQKAFMKDVLSGLQQESKNVEKERDRLSKALEKANQDYEKSVRTAREKGLTDEQKYYERLSEYDNLMNMARAQHSEEYYEKAREIAEQLGNEVRDENNNIVVSSQVAAQSSANMLEDIHRELTTMLQQGIDEQAAASERLKDSIKTVEEELDRVQERIKGVNSEKLNLQTEESINKLMDTNEELTDLKSKWDSLKSKEIVLTIRYNQVGKGPEGTEITQDYVPVEHLTTYEKNKIDTGEWKKGGLVRDKDLPKSKYRKGGITERIISKIITNNFREGGRVSKIVDKGKRFIERTSYRLREGGNVERVINNSIIHKFREGGDVRKISHTMDRLRKIESKKEGGLVRDQVFIQDHYKEGGKVSSIIDRGRDFIGRSIYRFKEGGKIEKVVKDSTTQRFREGGYVQKIYHTVDKSSGIETVSRFREGGMVERIIGSIVTNSFREGGKVSKVIDKSKNFIEKTRYKLREGGNVEKIIRDSIVQKFREGGNVQRILHTIDRSGRIERVSQFREGGKVYSSTHVIRDSQRYKEGKSVQRETSKLSTFKETIKRKIGGFTGKLLLAGGRLLGFGGGDIIPAMVEPGEWVIRKEAVLKYGSELFDKLNSLKIDTKPVDVSVSTPTVDSSESGEGEGESGVVARWGGIISKALKKNQSLRSFKIKKYQTGGFVNIARTYGDNIKKSINSHNSIISYVKPVYAQVGGMFSPYQYRKTQIQGPTPYGAQWYRPEDVATNAQGGGGGGVVVNLSPTFLMGDKRSAQAAAEVIRKELEVYYHRTR